MNGLNLCPLGWDVPTDAEWTVLLNHLANNGYGYGGSGDQIGKSMAATFRWNSSGASGSVGNDLGSNNSSRFTGLPGGMRSSSYFNRIGNFGYWWSSTGNNTTSVWFRSMYNMNGSVSGGFNSKGSGFYVRCLRDN